MENEAENKSNTAQPTGVGKLVKDFRPAIWFLAKFIGLYGGLSFIYTKGYLAWFGKDVDAMSVMVTNHTIWLMKLFGFNVAMFTYPNIARADIFLDNVAAVSVIQGCNGLAVMILFASFVFAFAGDNLRKLYFILAGFLFIHIVNMFRIMALSYIAIHFQKQLYYIQKHFFTTVIYLAVLLLWYLWVTRWATKKTPEAEVSTT